MPLDTYPWSHCDLIDNSQPRAVIQITVGPTDSMGSAVDDLSVRTE